MREFIRRQIRSFMISHVLITIVVGVTGMLLSPDTQLGYWAYFIPLLYAVLCVLPGFIMYSKKELTIRQVMVRKVLQLVLIEGIILGLLAVFGSLESIKVVVTIMISVVIVYVTVNLIEWISEVRDTTMMNQMLTHMSEEG